MQYNTVIMEDAAIVGIFHQFLRLQQLLRAWSVC